MENAWKRCPMCSARLDQKLHKNNINGQFMVACECGLYTKLFNYEEDLRQWWNTRGGRSPEKTRNGREKKDPEITVKHSTRVPAPKIQGETRPF